MGRPAAFGVIALQALTWTLILGRTGRVIVRGTVLPAVMAWSLLWAAFNLLGAHFLPDGNWGSLGYALAGIGYEQRGARYNRSWLFARRCCGGVGYTASGRTPGGRRVAGTTILSLLLARGRQQGKRDHHGFLPL